MSAEIALLGAAADALSQDLAATMKRHGLVGLVAIVFGLDDDPAGGQMPFKLIVTGNSREGVALMGGLARDIAELMAQGVIKPNVLKLSEDMLAAARGKAGGDG